MFYLQMYMIVYDCKCICTWICIYEYITYTYHILNIYEYMICCNVAQVPSQWMVCQGLQWWAMRTRDWVDVKGVKQEVLTIKNLGLMWVPSGFSHEKWWFSIATLNYQRVPKSQFLWENNDTNIDFEDTNMFRRSGTMFQESEFCSGCETKALLVDGVWTLLNYQTWEICHDFPWIFFYAKNIPWMGNVKRTLPCIGLPHMGFHGNSAGLLIHSVSRMWSFPPTEKRYLGTINCTITIHLKIFGLDDQPPKIVFF